MTRQIENIVADRMVILPLAAQVLGIVKVPDSGVPGAACQERRIAPASEKIK